MRRSRQLAVAVTATVAVVGVGVAVDTGSPDGDGRDDGTTHGPGHPAGLGQHQDPPANEAVGEVLAAGAYASDALPGLPVTPSATSSVAAWPLPHVANAHGAVVAGYPAALGPVSGSRVLSSSVSPQGRRLQAALRATGPSRGAGVLTAYRARLSLAGFHEVVTSAQGGADAAAFERGKSTVVVTVAPGRSGTYDIFASLWAGNDE